MYDVVARTMASEHERIDSHAVLDNLPDALFVVDRQRTISYTNQRLCDVLNISRVDLLDEPLAFLDQFVYEGFDNLVLAIDEVLSGRQADLRTEIEATLPEAAPVQQHITVDARVTAADGNGISGALVVLRNVEEYHERQAQLRHEAQRFRTMFERHSAPMLLIDPDSGRIENANRSAVEFYGYDADRLYGMSIERINCHSPEEVSRKRKRAHRGDQNCFQFEHRLASGETRAVEVRSSPIEIEGQTLLFSIVHDVTDRKESRRELRVFREAVAQAGHSVIITDVDGAIEYVNPAFEELTGYDGDEIAGETPEVLNSGRQDPQFYERLWETIRSGNIWEAELINQTKSGELYYAEHTIAPIVGDDGEITNFVAVQKDITERKLEQKRLSELHRILRHNVRNELAAIKGNAELLADKLDGENRRQLSWILNRADALDTTSEKITWLQQRIDSDHDAETACCLQTVLTELATEIREMYPDTKVDIDAEPVSIRMEVETCQQLLFELVENAIVHNDRDNPVVRVTVTSPNEKSDQVQLVVSDNGPGIPPQERTAVELGVEDPLKHGSGIGLSYIHWIVIEYGGDVMISDNDPRGSVVTLSLPCAEDSSEN